MATRLWTQSEHDRVVVESARTFSGYQKDGFRVTTNPGSEKNRWVGGEGNEKYPDVIVWLPSQSGSTSGKAFLIEEIETEESVSKEEARQWKEYADLGVEKFDLVVPLSKASLAKSLIEKNNINVTDLWSYIIANNVVAFKKYHSFTN